jgi:hypothetical protein
MSRLTNSLGFASKLLYSSKMPAFTLYGSRGSTNTDRVRLTLAEGLDEKLYETALKERTTFTENFKEFQTAIQLSERV